MKRFISLILVLTFILSCGAYAFAAEKGDVDADGKLTAADARITLRYSVSLEEFSEEEIKCADYNEDGTVTAADARSILRLSVGLSADPPAIPEDPPYEKPEEHVPSAKELKFYDTLYEVSHPLLGLTKPRYPDNFQKWCCEYTINDVFRPALKAAGYTQAQIDLLAPNSFPPEITAKALSNLINVDWPTWFVIKNFKIMIPSFLSHYYITTPKAAETFFLYDFYDDVIDNKVYEHDDEDRYVYEPRIGDVLFMSNKTKTYENGYPTVDHTAQITQIFDDGTFLCTEGSLVYSYEGDNRARVRERRYRFNETTGTYEYINNPIVIVLFAAQPKLS